jgi:hypothetical protein
MTIQVIPLDITEEVRKKILLELKALANAFHESIVTFYGAFYKVRFLRTNICTSAGGEIGF